MKERPILCKGPMVRSILAGTQTQTRRVAPIADLNIKPHSNDLVTWGVSFLKPVKGVLGSSSGGKFSDDQARRIIASMFCPYGQPGDRLWVRETFSHIYRTNDEPVARRTEDVAYMADNMTPDRYVYGTWKPSIHMPRWASRITLEVTGVRVERLQDISESDALAEGCAIECMTPTGDDSGSAIHGPGGYLALWESINGHGSWDLNPWVWIVEFRRIEA